MKKIAILSILLSLNVYADSIDNHVNESLKPIAKILEGKKGKVVLGTFISTKSEDTCAPSKSVNSKVSAALARSGVRTSVPSRPVNMASEQAEISRVTKLSGGSYVIVGSYELAGNKFKLDCTLFDHNGASVGACSETPAVEVSSAVADGINCPKAEKTEVITPVKTADEDVITDSKTKAIDDYICSVIHREYDLKRLVTVLYEKKLYSLEELKGIGKTRAEDALEVRKDYCVTLGNFVLCTDYWEGSGAQVFLGGSTSLGASKVLSWKHPKKSIVKNAERCLKKDDDWWNP